MTMNPNQSIEDSPPLLYKLRELLLQNKGTNLISGIDLVVEQIEDKNIIATERLSNGSRTYKELMGGAGTLGDFTIWNLNQEICNSLNKELDTIFESLWDIFK
jgi:hypothetical protein